MEDHHPFNTHNDDVPASLSFSFGESGTRTGHHFAMRKDDEGGAKPFNTLRVDEYIKDVPRLSQNWMIEGWLPYGYLAILSGTSKSGKTTFLTALAFAVARGEPFMGMPTVHGNVLWLALEESRTERAESIRNFDCQDVGFYVVHDQISLDSKQSITRLKGTVQANNIRLIVVDPLYLATSAQSLNDGRQARAAFQPLKDLVNELGVTAILVHHFTKNVGAGLTRERAADSNQLLALASADMIMGVEVKDNKRVLTLRSTGRGSFSNFDWMIDSTDETSFDLVYKGVSGSAASNKVIDQIKRFLTMNPGKSFEATQIAEAIGGEVTTVRNNLTQLKKEKRVTATTTDNKTKYSAVAPTASAPAASTAKPKS